MKRMWWRTALGLAAVLTLGACASAPTGPSVMVLPGAGKSLEQFQLDDGACRQWAGQQVGAGGDSWMMQRSYDIAYQQCMYSRDNQIPGVSAPGRVPGPPPPPGAPPPPPPPPARPPR
jgi:hypothetical protein